MSTRTIHIEELQYGQPRPYADSQYEAKVTFFQNGQPVYYGRDFAAQIIKGAFRDWQDTPACWASPRLSFLKPIEGTVHPQWKERAHGWHVLVTEPFTD